MGIDKRNYAVMKYPTRSEYVQFIDPSVLEQFLTDLTSGQITGYSLQDFFQNKSDWVSRIIYYPIDYTLFIPDTMVNAWLMMGNNTYTDYATTTWGIQKYKSVIKYFSTSVARTHNNFLDFNPYTQIQLYVPYFPLIELDPNVVYGKTIDGYLSLDFHTGKLTLYVYIDDTYLIESKTATIGIEISMGKSNIEEIKRNNIIQSISLLGSAATIGTGIATENPIAVSGGIGMATKNVTTALQNNVLRLSGYKGGTGDRTELSVDKNVCIIKSTPQDITYPNYSLKGGVCEKNLLLNSITGYTEIGNINFNPSNNVIYDDEISEIIQLLRDGVIL